MAAQDGSQLGPARWPRAHQFTIQDRTRGEAAEHLQFRIAAAIVGALPAPHRPFPRPTSSQGPHTVPLHLEEVIRGIKRRACDGEHRQGTLVHGSLRGFFRGRAREASASAGAWSRSAAATLCCRASSRGSTGALASTTGVNDRPWRVASTRAANCSARSSRYADQSIGCVLASMSRRKERTKTDRPNESKWFATFSGLFPHLQARVRLKSSSLGDGRVCTSGVIPPAHHYIVTST